MDTRIDWILDRDPGTSTLTTPGFIYFIRGEVTGAVKIGWATKPAERLKSLQIGSPDKLVLEATVPGTGRDEKALHKTFTAHRSHGEWFAGAPEILAHIADLKANPPNKVWEAPPDAQPPMTMREYLKAEREAELAKARKRAGVRSNI